MKKINDCCAFWTDGTKTIVKCHQPGDTFNKETGIAMAFMKRVAMETVAAITKNLSDLFIKNGGHECETYLSWLIAVSKSCLGKTRNITLLSGFI